jgi:hypothetical protein
MEEALNLKSLGLFLCSSFKIFILAEIAQLAVQHSCKVKAIGSTPILSSTFRHGTIGSATLSYGVG